MQQGNQRNFLSSLAGIGQQAVNQVGQAGQNYANNASNIAMNAGNNAAGAQIAQGNIDLSSRTEQQASALQQTAADPNVCPWCRRQG